MAIYDKSFTLDDLRAMRKRVLEQRAKGVASFSYNGQTFTYSSPDLMLKVVDELTREIRRRMGKDLGLIPVSLAGLSTHRPLSEPYYE